MDYFAGPTELIGRSEAVQTSEMKDAVGAAVTSEAVKTDSLLKEDRWTSRFALVGT